MAHAESSDGGLREGLGGWGGALGSRNEDLAGGSLSIGQIQEAGGPRDVEVTPSFSLGIALGCEQEASEPLPV